MIGQQYQSPIVSGENVIDSRDIIARIEWLETDEDALDDDERDELTALRQVADECQGCSDWQYAASLIADSYFREYAQELADDVGAINSSMSWPLTCIDWDRAARELQYDYTSVDFDGVTYWVRE